MKRILLLVIGLFAVCGNAYADSFYVGVPPGSDTEVPFNDGGEWGSDSALTFDKSTGTLSATIMEADSISSTATDDPSWYYESSTAGYTDWWTGVNHTDYEPGSDGVFEIRNSASVGTNVRWQVDTSGNTTQTGSVTATSFNVTPTDNAAIFYDPSTAGYSEWLTGPNHTTGATGPFEIRQSATPGTNVRWQVDTDGVETSYGWNVTDGTDTTTFAMKTEAGESNAELVIGLDESRRTMVLCDAGDVDADFNLSSNNLGAALFLMDADYDHYGYLEAAYGDLLIVTKGANAGIILNSQRTIDMTLAADIGNANYFININSPANTELTDTDAEQSWLYVEPKINQSSTAGYNALKIKVTETALGDASAATDSLTNNLILAGTSVDPDMFKVDNSGNVTTAGSLNSVNYKTIRIDAAAMVPCTTNGASAGTYEYATNDIDVDYYAFDGGATEERVQTKLVMPEDWDRSTVKVKFYWTSATGSTVTDDQVSWAIKAGALSNDDALDAALGTAVSVEDTLLASDGVDLQVTDATGALTIGGTPALGDLIVFEIFRDTDGSIGTTDDDMTEDAWLLYVVIQYATSNTAVSAW